MCDHDHPGACARDGRAHARGHPRDIPGNDGGPRSGKDGGPHLGSDFRPRPGSDGGLPTRGVSRRRLLRVGGVVLGASLAGCAGGGDVPAPVALTSGQACDVCGMVIQKHPGPNGEVYFRDDAPAGHDNPARFDSLKQCLFPYLWEKQRLGWEETAVYVTDYSSVDYTVNAEGGRSFLSSHPEAEAFARAKDLRYAVESDVEGAMGYDFVPFSNGDDASEFVEEWGGQVVSFDDIDETLVGK